MPFLGSFAASCERRWAYSRAVIPGVTAKSGCVSCAAKTELLPYVRQLLADGDVSHVGVARNIALRQK